MMLVTRAYEVRVDVYSRKILLVVGDSEGDCDAEYADQWAYNNPDDPHIGVYDERAYMGRYVHVTGDDGRGRDMAAILMPVGEHYREGGWGTSVWVTLAHECIHAAYDILGEVGVDVDSRNHEALTYLHSYIYRECMLHVMDAMQRKDHVQYRGKLERGYKKRIKDAEKDGGAQECVLDGQ